MSLKLIFVVGIAVLAVSINRYLILKIIFVLLFWIFVKNSTSVVDPEVSKTVTFSFHGAPRLTDEPYTIVHDSVKDKVRFCFVVAVILGPFFDRCLSRAGFKDQPGP